MGNHSLSHRSFVTSKAKVIRKQIVTGREWLRRYTGADTIWLRPPYGAMDRGAWKVVKATGSRVVMWDVDTHDWEKPSVKKMVRNVARHTKPGGIILMHDGGGDRKQTIKALPAIIDKLRSEGYVFVTVEEMYAAKAAK